MEEKTFVTVDELSNQATENYLKFLKEGKLTDILKVIGRMPDYTIMNDVLLMSQMPNVTLARRLSDWNKDGRKVKEHQKSLKVVSPCIRKYNQDYTDEQTGNMYVKGIEKFDLSVGHVFDISQTEGREYQYLNTNKETIAAFFETAKSSLEKTARGYKFSYVDQEPYAKLDKENKIVYIKDGLSIDELINTLVNQVTKVLIDSRHEEGLSENVKPNIKELEYNCALYAIKSKLGLNLPDYDYDQVAQYSDEETINRCAVMANFDKETLAKINDMWNDVKLITLPTYAIILITALIVGAIAAVVILKMKKPEFMKVKSEKVKKERT